MSQPPGRTGVKPIFGLTPIAKPTGLTTLVASNDIVLLLLSSGNIIKINNETGAEQTIRISRGKKDGPSIVRVHKIFLEPSGNHILISLQNGENWYMGSTMSQPKLLARFKGVIESVAWDSTNTNTTTTKEILLGSRNGKIYEALIESGKERYFKLLFNMKVRAPVTGLHMKKYRLSKDDTNRCAIIATTPTRFYNFVGGPSLEAVFSQYNSGTGHQEITPPMGTLNHSELRVCSSRKSTQSFAWLTGAGVFHGKFVLGPHKPGASIIRDTKLLPYPEISREVGIRIPRSIAMTDFHFILLYEETFQVVSRISNLVVDSQTSTGKIKMLGIAQDEKKNRMYVYSANCVFRLDITDEARHVWKLYLDINQYDKALYHASTADQRDMITCARADHLFHDGDYKAAAQAYGTTITPFEATALKFVAAEADDALITYLETKLATLDLKKGPHTEASQKTLLCTWLTELYMYKLNTISNVDESHVTTDLFRSFIDKHKEAMDKATTTGLMEEHGRMKELLYYWGVVGEWEKVIDYYISREQWENAISVLSKHGNASMFCKRAGVLLYHVPELAIHTAINNPDILPHTILPALMRYDIHHNKLSNKENHAIRYLEHCIDRGNENPVIHNYLLSLYIKEGAEEALLRFLSTPIQYFDLKYALRLCVKSDMVGACVVIYGSLHMYEEAVDLALTIDIELAKEYADKPEDDEIKKKLWLHIAKHVVQNQHDAKRAMELVQYSDLLRVEDVLPFFPDSVLIADFKDEVSTSLQVYNENIELLKNELSDATLNAELIRADTKSLRTSYTALAGNAKCEICKFTAITRQFYLFNCHHVFHWDCLIEKMQQYMSEREKRRIQLLQGKLQELWSLDKTVVKGELLNRSDAEEWREELNDLVASECLYCGTKMVESVGEPFIGPVDEAAIREWSLE